MTWASCTAGFQPFHCVFSHLVKVCDTFTAHHKANALVTQRHIVRTDVWLNWIGSRFLSWFINGSICNIRHKFPNQRRLSTNGKVLVLADCLHLVDWGGTGASGNMLLWSAPPLDNKHLNSLSRKQMQPYWPSSVWVSQRAIFTSWLWAHEDDGSKDLTGFLGSSPKRWSWLCAAPSGQREAAISSAICSLVGWGQSCAVPRTWHRSRWCFCCWEPLPPWQAWVRPASLASPVGSLSCSSRTCTVNVPNVSGQIQHETCNYQN